MAIAAAALRDAIHAEATERTWSQGVMLARGDRVAGVARREIGRAHV